MSTQKNINDLSYVIIGCAIEVHKQLGPGLLESVYQECFIEELKQNNLNVKSQIAVPITYKNKNLGTPLKLDILVNDQIIIELKAVESMIPVFQAQLLTYLKLTNKPKGLLINFHSLNISNSIVSLVTEEFSKLPVK
jgi:GxxExxY protein